MLNSKEIIQPPVKKPPTSVSKPLATTRNSVESNCKKVIDKLKASTSLYLKHHALQELCNYMLMHPESVSVFNRENTIKLLLNQKGVRDESTENLTRQALATLGFAPPVRGTGVKLLSIDGGGTKGLVILEVLRHLEKITGKPIYQSFDLIAGVSTGAILATLLGIFRLSIDECAEIYRETSSIMFKSDLLSGTSRLLFKHAWYDTSKWEAILKEMFTDKTLIETAQNKDGPRVVFISALINTPTLQPFAFRNYNLPDKSIAYYESSYKYKIWEAIRASAAAPGYFEEFILDGLIHQDGGLLVVIRFLFSSFCNFCSTSNVLFRFCSRSTIQHRSPYTKPKYFGHTNQFKRAFPSDRADIRRMCYANTPKSRYRALV